MTRLDWNIGVCSWSLNNNLEKLSELITVNHSSYIHLQVRPELGHKNVEFIDSVIKQGWKISATMVSFEHENYSTLENIAATGGIVPLEHWHKSSEKVKKAIDITAGLGVQYLTFHFGLIDAGNESIVERVRSLADYALDKGVVLLMETGQETAEQLRAFLLKLNHNSVAINFDPANMILYAKGNPIEAVGLLKQWIRHVHIKDAVATSTPGQWGSEVVWGTGDVQASSFLDTLNKDNYSGTLSVERERRASIEDVICAIKHVQKYIDAQLRLE